MSDVIKIGDGFADPASFNYSSLFSSLSPSGLATLQALSADCTLQQALSFGELLVKHDWGEEDKSYCQWHGKPASLPQMYTWSSPSNKQHCYPCLTRRLCDLLASLFVILHRNCLARLPSVCVLKCVLHSPSARLCASTKPAMVAKVVIDARILRFDIHTASDTAQAVTVSRHLSAFWLGFESPMTSQDLFNGRWIAGITCCKTAGDRLSNYCVSPQSVAQIYLPGIWCKAELCHHTNVPSPAVTPLLRHRVELSVIPTKLLNGMCLTTLASTSLHVHPIVCSFQSMPEACHS